MDELDLQTGDVLLFSGKKSYFIDWAIEYFTESKYSHVGIVIKDPPSNTSLKGIYILESTETPLIKDAEDGKYKLGVSIKLLSDKLKHYDGKMFVRKLHAERDEAFHEKVNKIHSIVHDKPYDLDAEDWLDAVFRTEFGNVHKQTTFICSALVSFFLVGIEAVAKDTPWTVLRPSDLGTDAKRSYRMTFINNCTLDREIEFKL